MVVTRRQAKEINLSFPGKGKGATFPPLSSYSSSPYYPEDIFPRRKKMTPLAKRRIAYAVLAIVYIVVMILISHFSVEVADNDNNQQGGGGIQVGGAPATRQVVTNQSSSRQQTASLPNLDLRRGQEEAEGSSDNHGRKRNVAPAATLKAVQGAAQDVGRKLTGNARIVQGITREIGAQASRRMQQLHQVIRRANPKLKEILEEASVDL